jgi:phosphomannomutase/phosphoglucomutase
MFGTNGIREVVGARLTPPLLNAVSEAIARVAPPGRPIAIGRDGRTSSPAISALIDGTLRLSGRDVVDLGLLPTPAIQYSVPIQAAGFGVAITASHNPPEYNGIKCFDEHGHSVPPSTERAIEAAMASGPAPGMPYDRIGTSLVDPSGGDRYVKGVMETVDRELVRDRRFTVVLDCGNGATAVTSPELLRRLGCRVITLNGQPDGHFPGRLSEPNPATLRDLVGAVPHLGADLGIAHDGDGDRTIFVDDRGRFVPGERSFALLAREAVRRDGGGTVVTPVSTSRVLEDVLGPVRGTVVYTPVGSPWITREVERSGAVMGGEENGGVVFPRFQLARDGAMTAASMLQLLAESGRSLAETLDALPSYSLVKERVPCPPEQARRILPTIAQDLSSGARQVLTLDGFKIFTDEGWTLLRCSGTEPIIRIFVETRDAERSRRVMVDAVARVRALLPA